MVAPGWRAGWPRFARRFQGLHCLLLLSLLPVRGTAVAFCSFFVFCFSTLRGWLRLVAVATFGCDARCSVSLRCSRCDALVAMIVCNAHGCCVMLVELHVAPTLTLSLVCPSVRVGVGGFLSLVVPTTHAIGVQHSIQVRRAQPAARRGSGRVSHHHSGPRAGPWFWLACITCTRASYARVTPGTIRGCAPAPGITTGARVLPSGVAPW